MALPVDVSSIDALRAVREALVLFVDDAGGALGAMDMEIQRCLGWLAHDQRIFWQSEVKRRAEKLSEAQSELHRKQTSKMFGQGSHESEQRDKVRQAKHRLEEAHEKVETVRRWIPVVERAVMEYHGQSRPFADALEFDAGASIELLDRMIAALEDYIRDAAPTSRVAVAAPAAPAAATPKAAAVEAAPQAEAEAEESSQDREDA